MGRRNTAKTPPASERVESRLLVSYAFDLARKLEISKVLVLADLLQDRQTVENVRDGESIIWVVRGDGEEIASKRGDHQIGIPDTQIGRTDQVKIGLILSVLRGAIGADETVVCLTGLAGSRRLDNLLIANARRDFPWFSGKKSDTSNRLLTSPPFARVLEIALKFGREGREGKPIGTVFVLGTPAKLKPFCRPLIMNPCEGHSAKARDIQNPDYLETIRELAGLDGAFLVDRRGVVVGAGIYLDAPVTKAVNVSAGLGARHMAAAAISTKGGTVAVVVSESSGLVTVFSEGSAVLEIARAN